ncbi:MAG: hypothetical protein C6W58_02480 [Bacillaceae bacterium]|nr:MAG: hypothetical protein C6W58_02480 [Bacillaceae bacterium]
MGFASGKIQSALIINIRKYSFSVNGLMRTVWNHLLMLSLLNKNQLSKIFAGASISLVETGKKYNCCNGIFYCNV